MYNTDIKPSTMFIMYTLSCNSKCRMCSFWKNTDYISIENDLVYEKVREGYKSGLRTIFFTGGECLIFAEKLFDISARLLDSFSDIKLKINTNGILIGKYAKQIAKYFDTVIVSMDSLDENIYSSIRGVDELSNIIAGINTLKQIRPEIRISLRCLLLEDNIDGIDELISFSVNNNIDKLSFIAEDRKATGAFGRKEDLNKTSDSYELGKRIEEKMRALMRKYEDQFISGRILYEKGHDLIRGAAIYMNRGVEYKCNCSTHCIVLYPNGSISPCFFVNSVGDVSIHGLYEVLNSREYQKCVHVLNSKGNSICKNCVCPVVFA